MYVINDYELLYLIRVGNPVAMDILMNKYKNFIYKTIHDFHINHNIEDYFQEGLITLWEATKSFNDDYNKTFTKYFDVILRRKFSSLISKEPKYILKSDLDDTPDLSDVNDVIFDYSHYEGLFKGMEKAIYTMYYCDNIDKEIIIKVLNIKDERSFHNALYRIKNKIIQEFNSLNENK